MDIFQLTSSRLFFVFLSRTHVSLVNSFKTSQSPLSTSSSVDKPANSRQPTANDEPTPKIRRTRSDGGARQRAIAIFNALRQWNQQHPDYTFALTPALLEVTFHIHRSAAHQFIDEFREQIEQHHHAIGVGTVRTHNRGKDIEPLKAFVTEQSRSVENT